MNKAYATTTVGEPDVTGSVWRIWNDVGLDCENAVGATRVWDVTSMNVARVQAINVSKTSVPVFTSTVQWSIDGSSWFTSGVTINNGDLTGGASFLTAEIDVSSVCYLRLAITTAAGTALKFDVSTYASNTVGLAVS